MCLYGDRVVSVLSRSWGGTEIELINIVQRLGVEINFDQNF